MVTSKQEKPRRLPPAERRQQIVDAVLRVVAEHGVPGASTARLSKAAGVSQGTLYQYFASRQEMFAAALDEIFAQMEALFLSVTEPHPIDRIREEVRRHADLMKTGHSFVSAWMEFVAAGTHEGLRPDVARIQVRVFAMLKELVEQGKAEGAIRPEVDSERLVWQWQTVLWGENMSCLMGLPAFMDEGHSAALLDLVLDTADARRLPPATSPADGLAYQPGHVLA